MFSLFTEDCWTDPVSLKTGKILLSLRVTSGLELYIVEVKKAGHKQRHVQNVF